MTLRSYATAPREPCQDRNIAALNGLVVCHKVALAEPFGSVTASVEVIEEDSQHFNKVRVLILKLFLIVMVKENLQVILNEIENGNHFGEKVTLVGATKFMPVELINEAIDNGLLDIAENRAQEFKDKFPLVHQPVNYHFIGHLQKNKVKYLIGKCHLIQSVDTIDLLDEINRQSLNKEVVSNVLLEVNLGEEQKHGFQFSEVENALSYALTLKGVKVLGLMAMLPESDDEELLFNLSKSLRALYDEFKEKYSFTTLSLGMSNDYKIAIKAGSNMIRVGSKIFGKRY